MRWPVLLLLGACTKDATQPIVAPTVPEDAAAAPDALAPRPLGPLAPSEDAAAQDVLEAQVPKAIPKQVLHVGDSMVGGYGGLTKALEARFKTLGSKFARDWQTSVSIQTFARDKHFAELIAKHNPDLVIITLGANDMLVPFPKSLASFIQAIAKKTAGRECWWLPPVPWTKEIGLIQAIKDSAAPCKVYDGSPLAVQRGPDGIHPTDRGGAVWADGFFKSYDAPETTSP